MIIDTSDIQRAIRETFEYRLKDITFTDSSVKIPLRPSFVLNYIAGSSERTSCAYEIKKTSFELVYFADDTDGNLSLTEIEKSISYILKEPVETLVGDIAVSIDIDSFECSANITDNILTTVIDVKVLQKVSEDIRNNSHSRFSNAVNTNEEMLEEITK